MTSWTREDLQATMSYFVYYINTIALYWEEKPTSLMNENKWIDNPRITIVECGRWLLRWQNALNHDYKNNYGRNFQFTKFKFIDFVLTDSRSLSGKRPKSASGKSSSCRFSFSDERNANTKATEYATFGFYFSLLSHRLLVLKDYSALVVFSNLALISRFTRITFNWKQGIVGWLSRPLFTSL